MVFTPPPKTKRHIRIKDVPSNKGWILICIIVFKGLYAIYSYFFKGKNKTIDETVWKTNDSNESEKIEPFVANIPDKILEDLATKLKNTWLIKEDVAQHYGNMKLLKQLVEFWKSKYSRNWRKREESLNITFPQYTVLIQGLKIHYLHVKPAAGTDLKVKPLLLIHGWPSSVTQFYELIPYLTIPQPGRHFVFEVIAPSIPGCGFSEGPTKSSFGVADVAVIFKNLMDKLEIPKCYIQGGDLGSIIAQAFSVLFPGKVLGVHLNNYVDNSISTHFKLLVCSYFPRLLCYPDEINKVYPLKKKYCWFHLKTDCYDMCCTKPDAIGIALQESPVGLAAYILEKITSLTSLRCVDLDFEEHTLTCLLDNVMIYWVSRSIATSMNLYEETIGARYRKYALERFLITVPAAIVRFSNDINYIPESIIRNKFVNLDQLSDYEGRFSVLECQQLLAMDLYNFVRTIS